MGVAAWSTNDFTEPIILAIGSEVHAIPDQGIQQP